jgi:hypothetical protein
MGICERGQKCTCFIDRLFNKDWSICCQKHDEDYYRLSTGKSTKDADIQFLECLKLHTWKPLAYIMYGAVRIFGRKFK